MYKPELLLPAGNTESFFAAISGGADAIYLGLKKFNARNRAKNFSFSDLPDAVNFAHSKNKKIYITLNTLIKNEEINELIEVLHILSQINIDAIIIQDLSILNLVNNFYKNLKIHASTQMAVHNSSGCNYFEKIGFERVILAREITGQELKHIVTKSKIQKEIFVHGALCYSLSGHCLFSSYLGGNSANRGLCTQVCRRNFISDNSEGAFFSLKDFQLIDFIPFFSKLKISSLKIEGRMKNPEYIYNVAKAYRMAIDDHSKIEEAKGILKNDYAREKTSWFMGKDIKNSITTNTNTGLYVGKIHSVNKDLFKIISEIKLNERSKLRSRNSKDTETEYIRIYKISNSGKEYSIYCNTGTLSVNDEIYLAGTNVQDFKTKFPGSQTKNLKTTGEKQRATIKNLFRIPNPKTGNIKLFLRISDISDIKRIEPDKFEAIFFKIRSVDLSIFTDTNSLQQNETIKNKFNVETIGTEIKQKLHLELPKYISENKISEYKDIIKKLTDSGLRNFVISNISQIELLPKNCNISCNENIYLLNDIAINFVQSKGIKNYCYPLENDYPNMLKGKDRNGIIPVYYYPELFYSRMPKNVKSLKDDNGKQFRKLTFNGFTIITDKNPVSLTHNINKFRNKGFYKFLIDISLEPNKQKLPYIINAFNKSEKIKGSEDFNIKKGLH